MRYLILCLSFVILGCSNQADLKPDLQQSVSEATQENEPVFSTGYADLNGDGLEDAVVFLKGMQWCGSGGCTLMIFQNLGNSYQLISKSSVTSTPISVAKTETNGWKDLIVWSRGSGLVLMKFNGEQYPHNPSLEPADSEPQMLEVRLILE
ncbi:hypothetical protein ERW51_11730 [Aliivibrio finisterrensis]|uniref:hypothetical protein n=1 Tax=Aliivibrio finisterrensis TaxID=511998 RepID=UPI00102102BD|nr:hypothetical protein [Aliivibrio finisterrensis]RYU67470.1 hypothetical protein ERW54_12460 [Aliivibrio finisterrensis]RYU70879.1 hypothetical protein ERW51_11730 [Aliivibrio finisterrensis]RYU74135.1 hypothetical protein ERW48_11315 [Aliivibrio finisterrensis]